MDVLLPFFAQYYNEWSVLHMSENGNQSREWNSRFGYIMVAAGAAIGLGNIWKFAYLALKKVTKIIMPVLFLFLIICVSEQCS